MNKLQILLRLLTVPVILNIITSNSAFAQIPADYKGKPFDNARHMSDFYFNLLEREKPKTEFIPGKVVWDSKKPIGSGRTSDLTPLSSVGLTVADVDSMQLIHFRGRCKQWNELNFAWNWAAPQEKAIDPRQFDAISFSIKISGKTIIRDLFFSLSEHHIPVSLFKYNPAFSNGAWHTITIPLGDLKLSPGATAIDTTEVRGILFSTYNWDFKECDYEVYLDHISFDQKAKPVLNKQYRFEEVKGQKIPGKVECAYYDEGGEGVAYHDSNPQNYLSGLLNQSANHERPNSNPYLWNFRIDEGVDISYTKDFADYNHPNLFIPPMNQLYIGAVEKGEWVNYTVDVEKEGKYKVFLMYGGTGVKFKLTIDNQPDEKMITPINTEGNHFWNRAEVATLSFSRPGIHLLTLTNFSGGNFGHFEFELVNK
jgi:hypothetical protein